MKSKQNNMGNKIYKSKILIIIYFHKTYNL